MNNLGLQNILIPNVPTARVKGNVAAKIIKGQSSDEFAQLLTGMNNTIKSQALPQNPGDVLKLISESLKSQPDILNHVGLQGAPQTLFGKTPVNADPIQLQNLVGSNAMPEADFIQKVEGLFTQNPKLLATLKSNPQIAGQLNLEVVVNPEMGGAETIKFKKELPFKLVKEFVAKTSNQGPELAAMGRVIPMTRVKNTTLKQVGGNSNVFGPEKKITQKIQVATNTYAAKQAQLDSNIIKMPQAMAKDDAGNSQMMGRDAEVMNFNAFAQQNITQRTATPMGVTTQVVDLSSVDISNPQELIQKISDYIQQNSLTKADGLDLLVKHNDLGQFKISVAQGAAKDQINMQILTMSKEGHEFFKVNEQGLLKSLTQSGVALSDFSILTKDIPRGSADLGSFSHNGNSQTGQNGRSDQQNSQQRDSNRRREAWEEYRERFSA
ncbi:MAG: hypothetical protein KAG61_03800 [Bacteriovoracaceae bacterium]|nr:hypothetical protein [Bacteriovoracaceae bacterium]